MCNPTKISKVPDNEWKKSKFLWFEVWRTLYRCLESVKLLWETITKHLTDNIGFTTSPYDICIANKVTECKKCIIAWYIGDFKMSQSSERLLMAQSYNSKNYIEI